MKREVCNELLEHFFMAVLYATKHPQPGVITEGLRHIKEQAAAHGKDRVAVTEES